MEMAVRNVGNLFNSLDPAPFREKDLDEGAVEFIVSWALEHPIDKPLSLRILVKEWPAQDPGPMVREAVRNYFAYREKLVRLEFAQLMKRARTSLFIGLFCLGFCTAMVNYVLAGKEGTWMKVLSESLVIAGWVVMWRPLELYLYDWWPLRDKRRLYDKLSNMPVEVVPQG